MRNVFLGTVPTPFVFLTRFTAAFPPELLACLLARRSTPGDTGLKLCKRSPSWCSHARTTHLRAPSLDDIAKARDTRWSIFSFERTSPCFACTKALDQQLSRMGLTIQRRGRWSLRRSHRWAAPVINAVFVRFKDATVLLMHVAHHALRYLLQIHPDGGTVHFCWFERVFNTQKFAHIFQWHTTWAKHTSRISRRTGKNRCTAEKRNWTELKARDRYDKATKRVRTTNTPPRPEPLWFKGRLRTVVPPRQLQPFATVTGSNSVTTGALLHDGRQCSTNSSPPGGRCHRGRGCRKRSGLRVLHWRWVRGLIFVPRLTSPRTISASARWKVHPPTTPRCTVQRRCSCSPHKPCPQPNTTNCTIMEVSASTHGLHGSLGTRFGDLPQIIRELVFVVPMPISSVAIVQLVLSGMSLMMKFGWASIFTGICDGLDADALLLSPKLSPTVTNNPVFTFRRIVTPTDHKDNAISAQGKPRRDTRILEASIPQAIRPRLRDCVVRRSGHDEGPVTTLRWVNKTDSSTMFAWKPKASPVQTDVEVTTAVEIVRSLEQVEIPDGVNHDEKYQENGFGRSKSWNSSQRKSWHVSPPCHKSWSEYAARGSHSQLLCSLTLSQALTNHGLNALNPDTVKRELQGTT